MDALFTLRGADGNAVFAPALPPVIAPPVASVTGVVVTPADAIIAGGAQRQYSAVVNGPNNPSQQVIWTCTAGTVIAGLVTANQPAGQDQIGSITATSLLDPDFSHTVYFTIPAAIVIEPPAPITTRALVWRLGEANGPAANLVNMMVSFALGTGPHDTGPCVFQSNTVSTNDAGELAILLDAALVAAGAVGVLSVLMPDGRHFLGRVTVP